MKDVKKAGRYDKQVDRVNELVNEVNRLTEHAKEDSNQMLSIEMHVYPESVVEFFGTCPYCEEFLTLEENLKECSNCGGKVEWDLSQPYPVYERGF